MASVIVRRLIDRIQWVILSLFGMAAKVFTPKGIKEDRKTVIKLFRITGQASIARIRPVLLKLGEQNGIVWKEASDPHAVEKIDFVWETSVSLVWKDAHRAASVLNRLHNTHIFEDKGNMALLQKRMRCKTLESYIMLGKKAMQKWVQGRLSSKAHEKEWWIIKASAGNGGADIWVIHKGNAQETLAQIPEGGPGGKEEEFVAQRYVERPLLRGAGGLKFHLRTYQLLAVGGGDRLQPYFYEMAYILTAMRPYRLGAPSDDLRHISNMAVNKHEAGYPGQIPCRVPVEFPALWASMTEVWAELVRAAAPFLQVQANARHFEFYGLDFLADADGETAWLLEVNRLPGLQASAANKAAEDQMYNKMIADLLELIGVSLPLEGTNLWQPTARPEEEVEVNPKMTWKNTFNFKAFVKRAGQDIIFR